MAKTTISDLAQSGTKAESFLTDLEELSDKELKAISGGYKWKGRRQSTNVEDRRHLSPPVHIHI
jgi:bacteriocin-like protein